MAEIKTKATKVSVSAFLKSVEPPLRRMDGEMLLKLCEAATGQKAVMWGDSIVGFGSYHYESTRSAQKGDWPLLAFSPRKQAMTVYIMPGFKEYDELLTDLGPHKKSVSCLYIKRLSDVNLTILKRLLKRGYTDMARRYPK